VIGLLAGLAWLAGSWAARRSLGWFPPRGAKIFFLLGWVPILGLGVALGTFLRDRLSRWNAGLPLVAIALVTPWVGVQIVPGLQQPFQYPIPGRPWLAVSAAPDGTFDLYLMKGSPGRLTAYGETPWIERSPALSPDRRHMVFSSNRYGSYDLLVMDLDPDGEPAGTRRLTGESGDELGAVWAPDGKRIAYEVRTDQSSTIEVIDAGGGAPMVLAGVENAANPEWSPDGQRIASSAVSTLDLGDLDIWIANADGSDPRDVIDVTPTDWSPVWSPDGKRICFTGGRESNWDVFLANTDGTGIRDLTVDSFDKDTAYGWSPDGSKVLILSDRSHTGGTFLYFMDPDGANVRLALRI
jgi:TolB protein